MPQKTPDTVLILSSNFGQGHMATARALQSAAEQHPEYNLVVEVVDFSEEVNRLFNTASKKIYELNAKHTPLIHKWIYESTDKSPLPIRLINVLSYPTRKKTLLKLIEDHHPSLVISNYPIWQYIAYSLTKEYFDVEFATLITDSISVHSAWATPDSDFYLVANEPTAASLHNLGVANKKIFPLGYPVHADFMTPPNPKLRTELGLTSDQPLITVSASSLRLSYVKRLARSFAHLPQVTFLIVTGRDIDLYEGLSDKNFALSENCKLIAWTNQMPEIIKNSELVITKAGGSTVMECIAAKKPMIINKVIPGQEEGNAELVERYQLGAVVSNPVAIREAISTIRADLPSYTTRLAKLSQPDASAKILAFIRQRLG